MFFQFRKLVLKYFKDPGKIAGVPHIHCIADGGYGGPASQFLPGQVPGYTIVYIAGGNEMLHRQTGLKGQDTCTDVSKVSAGNTDDGCICFVPPLFPGKEIIELLWQPAGHVD